MYVSVTLGVDIRASASNKLCSGYIGYSDFIELRMCLSVELVNMSALGHLKK